MFAHYAFYKKTMEEFIRFRRDKGRKLLLNIVLFLSWYSKKYDMLIRNV